MRTVLSPISLHRTVGTGRPPKVMINHCFPAPNLLAWTSALGSESVYQIHTESARGSTAPATLDARRARHFSLTANLTVKHISNCNRHHPIQLTTAQSHPA
jgi:hypothetical protein